MKTNQAHEIAMKLEGVTLKDHFGSDSYSANKRMFFTLWSSKKQGSLRLSPVDQREFLASDADAFSEIDNAWGKQGWTTVHLEHIRADEFEKALVAAWKYSAVKKAKSSKIVAGRMKKKK